MNWKIFLGLALGLNAALGLMTLSQRSSKPGAPEVEVLEVQIPSGTQWITNVILETNVVTATFHWSEMESADYAEYVSNLRRIGCPQDTIRDILAADLNAVFDARARALADGPSRQFWELLLDSEKFEAIVSEKHRELTGLRTERDELLKSLLGTDTPPDTVPK